MSLQLISTCCCYLLSSIRKIVRSDRYAITAHAPYRPITEWSNSGRKPILFTSVIIFLVRLHCFLHIQPILNRSHRSDQHSPEQPKILPGLLLAELSKDLEVEALFNWSLSQSPISCLYNSEFSSHCYHIDPISRRLQACQIWWFNRCYMGYCQVKSSPFFMCKHSTVYFQRRGTSSRWSMLNHLFCSASSHSSL